MEPRCTCAGARVAVRGGDWLAKAKYCQECPHTTAASFPLAAARVAAPRTGRREPSDVQTFMALRCLGIPGPREAEPPGALLFVLILTGRPVHNLAFMNTEQTLSFIFSLLSSLCAISPHVTHINDIFVVTTE